MTATPDTNKTESGSKVRVLIVDDSPTVRAVLRSLLAREPRLELVGSATNGLDALAKIEALRPDVCTLDIEMPHLDGLDVLARATGRFPVAFIMISTLTQTGARITFQALRRGAFDYIPKPESVLTARDEFAASLIEKVLAAGRAKGRVRPELEGGVKIPAPAHNSRGWVVGIGISCGGPQTLSALLPAFPADFAPILVTQHMPVEFTPMFARHLDQICAMRVKEAEAGDQLTPGRILVAPGDAHLCLKRLGERVYVVLDSGPKVSGHRPSADAMFASMAAVCAPRCVGLVMTGMGRDGSSGIVKLRQAGCPTIAQDEATSLVFGMPAAAAATGCVDRIAPLSKIPQAIVAMMTPAVRSCERAGAGASGGASRWQRPT
jgi:two-component system chemotaxis response regulator CheB